MRQAGIVVQYKIGEGSFGKCVKVLNRKNRQVVLVSVGVCVCVLVCVFAHTLIHTCVCVSVSVSVSLCV